jgi:GNAT superfamily N-acetyltransferase
MNKTIITGLLDFFQSITEGNNLPHSEFHNSSERTMYCSGINYAPLNGVLDKGKNDIDPAQIVAIIDTFQSKKLPLVWWTDNKILEIHGFQFAGSMKGISLDLSESKINPKKTIPANLKIDKVQTRQEMDQFCKILDACFGLGEEATKQYSIASYSALKQQKQIHYLGYLDGRPVSTLTLTITPTSTGLWNGATQPEYRKRGISTALSCEALSEAKKRGYKEAIAILMPKGLAASMTQNLGFKEVCNLPFYIFGSSSESIEK